MRRANLFHGELGTGLDSSWTGVDLRGADLRGAHAQVRFERVDFRNARFTATDWGWSDLVGCAFAGVVHGLTIGRRPIADRPAGWTLREVDLTAARPRDLVLNGVDLGAPEVDVRLPAGDEHWRIRDWPAFLDRVATAVAIMPDGDEDRAAATIWHEYASRSRRHPPDGGVHRYLGRPAGSASEALHETLSGPASRPARAARQAKPNTGGKATTTTPPRRRRPAGTASASARAPRTCRARAGTRR